jgi:hypothetical protein
MTASGRLLPVSTDSKPSAPSRFQSSAKTTIEQRCAKYAFKSLVGSLRQRSVADKKRISTYNRGLRKNALQKNAH